MVAGTRARSRTSSHDQAGVADHTIVVARALAGVPVADQLHPPIGRLRGGEQRYRDRQHAAHRDAIRADGVVQAFWIEREDGAVLLRERPDKGLLGGMMEVPSTGWTAKGVADPAAEAPVVAAWRRTGRRIEHTFTHFHLELEIWAARLPPAAEVADPRARWVMKHDLGGEALPSVMRKIVAEMCAPGQGPFP